MLVIPVYDTLILSNIQINVQEEVFSEQEIENIKEEDEFIIVPIKTQKSRSTLAAEDFYDVGILATASTFTNNEGTQLFAVDTKERVKITALTFSEGRVDAGYEVLQDIPDISEKEEKDYFDAFKHYAEEVIKGYPGAPMLRGLIRRWKSLNEAATNMGSYLDIDSKERFTILSSDSLKERYELILEGIKRLVGSSSVKRDIEDKMSKEQEDSYKVMAIKKQLKYLEKELQGLEGDSSSDEEKFEQKIAQSDMPQEAKKEANRVLKRMKMEGGHGSEYGTLYDYLDFMTSLSWKASKQENVDIAKARKILDRDHFGLEKVKERILEQIAVNSLKGKQAGSILLFVGAPGTGKTSMGQSIAHALGREYVRISLGGVHDEAEIRGHRRTYVGAMPGRIMEGIKRSGVSNPVVVLDEIDKLAKDYRSDPSSALLEVLDPEQNHTFMDHYLNVPYDLSQVFFLCTANTLDGIPRPLLDRMEVISLSGYTPMEKYHIGRKYLLPKAIEDAGLQKGQVTITQGALKKIIANYTMEAGVRGLKKQLDKICRYSAIQILEKESEKISIKEKDLQEILGNKKASHDEALKKQIPGVATGLAWTQVGGEILFIESVQTEGSGKIQITGQLGDVMKESAEIAYTLVKSHFADSGFAFDKKDVHIHVPEGATPKDGPSAGVTLFTALASLVLKKPVKKKLAMTGEVSLRGEVLPIGGLPEKLMAAQRAGITTVLIPRKNEEDLKEVPEEITGKLSIIPVETIAQVAKESMGVVMK